MLSIKGADQRERHFLAYHKLIQQLVEREEPDQPMRIDRQIAVIFELRNFKEYFPVTLRILRGLKSLGRAMTQRKSEVACMSRSMSRSATSNASSRQVL